MRFLCLIIAICLSVDSKSQEITSFAPTGSTFYYSTWFPPYPELLKFVSNGDTVLNGITARILEFYQTGNGVLVPVPSLNKYLYTSGNKVYYWVQDDFYLLYDFGAQPGDTIHSRVEDFPHSLSCFSYFSEGPFNFSYVIDSLGTMTIDGIELRVQYVTPIYSNSDQNWTMPSPIVERIGQYSISAFWWGRGSDCALGGIPGELRCYTDEEIYFKNESAQFDLECDYISATENIIDSPNSIYPNPANDFVTLPKGAELFFIYDLYGRILKEGKTEKLISLRDLPLNVYVVHYKIENTWHIERLIKN